jgi:RpiB/LacA/LacB family sugar-phosphate isomerase
VKIAIGSDHLGYPLKMILCEHLRTCGHEVLDLGTTTDQTPVDYPDFARRVTQQVAARACDRGVVVCGSGVGMSVAANKFPGVRAVLCNDPEIARLSRAHNDSNVLAMGALTTPVEKAVKLLDTWLTVDYEGGRHIPRLAKLDLAFQEEWRYGYGSLEEIDRSGYKIGIALSPEISTFSPLMFAGNLRDGLDNAQKLGFDGVELSLRDPGNIELDKLTTLLTEHNLKAKAIATGQSYLRDGLSLTSEDSGIRQKALERLRAHLHLAGELGAMLIVGGIRGRLSSSKETQKTQKAFFCEAIVDLARSGEKTGTTVLIEPINRYETNFINTVDEGLGIIQQIGMDNLKLLPDTFHMNIEESDLEGAILRAGHSIGYMHFADSNRRAAGQGHINFVRILQALNQAGYHGMITSEILPVPDDHTAMAQAAGFKKMLLDR